MQLEQRVYGRVRIWVRSRVGIRLRVRVGTVTTHMRWNARRCSPNGRIVNYRIHGKIPKPTARGESESGFEKPLDVCIDDSGDDSTERFSKQD